MTNEEAARILDPATSAEALRPYALDCVMRMAVVEEAEDDAEDAGQIGMEGVQE